MSNYTLPVVLRDEVGSGAARRMRAAGNIPSVLYGHKQENINLLVSRSGLDGALKAKARMVTLEWGGNHEDVLLKELQYDYLGDDVIHVDFARIDAGEKVTLDVPVELYGDPVGRKKHGVLTHSLKKISVECVVTSIPEKIRVDVSGLDVDQSVLVSGLTIAGDVKVINSPDAVVASVHLVAEEKEVTDEEAIAEPEVIAEKKDVDEGAE